MDNPVMYRIAGGIGFVLILLGAAYIWYPRTSPSQALLESMTASTTLPRVNDEVREPTTPPAAETPAEAPKEFSKVRIALLDTEGSSDGVQRACDKVVMVERTIPATPAPLTAALTELFAINDATVGGYYNFMARTNETLSFDRVTIVGGVANVYLTGSLSGLAGVCDDPRARIQIEETAMQFPTVASVRIFLNGELTDLTPNERGE